MNDSIKQKILLLLLTGAIVSFSRSPLQHYRAYKNLIGGWREINKQNRRKFNRMIQSLYVSKIIKEKKNPDGSFTFVLSDKGKIKALTYHFQDIKVKEKNWDKKWRLVFFDVPEKHRWGRDVLRRKLRELGFYELQKSVFVFPYECEDEIDFIVEYFKMRKYVRYAVIDYIDNDIYLKKNFSLK